MKSRGSLRRWGLWPARPTPTTPGWRKMCLCKEMPGVSRNGRLSNPDLSRVDKAGAKPESKAGAVMMFFEAFFLISVTFAVLLAAFGEARLRSLNAGKPFAGPRSVTTDSSPRL
eukprot:126195-Chlamydomonas_euryale.AAC.12